PACVVSQHRSPVSSLRRERSLLRLEAAYADLVSPSAWSAAPQIFQLSTRTPADYPIFTSDMNRCCPANLRDVPIWSHAPQKKAPAIQSLRRRQRAGNA